MTLSKISNGVYADSSQLGALCDTDAIIFDCDGVLVDITKSYDLAITRTARHVLKNMANITNPIEIDRTIIDGFKSTGGFNDEIDLTYVVILCITAAKLLERDPTGFIFDVIKNSDSTGIASVEAYLGNMVDISFITKQLSYPGSGNILSQIFDQLFYGPQLYEKLFAKSSDFADPGLIEQDDVLLNDTLIEHLVERFDSKVAMVTGRGRESASHSLGLLLSKFDLSNSVFLEDESRDLAKPNPGSLQSSIRGMNSVCALYVGDSMEDLIMAQRATKLGCKTIFCGIVGTSQDKLELFERNGAVLALDSIHRLPKVLNLE